ncbi:site-specific integrase [Paraburkholderia aspalathi]|uniref:site-specific integrase n=1 Tax=Paraburkholderia aspalathi TaxID=1324617 RepID=UPI001B1EB505|nr:site-specific integrase [Paraburkholderia aspalathi]CAE6856847.1 Tyrosine recombinase XerC [Paraburkholderia aspalathi]
MKYIIDKQVALTRPLEGPLSAHIASFSRSINDQGYSAFSLNRQVQIAAGFSRWLKQSGIELGSVCSDHAIRYFRYRARHVRLARGDRAALRHLIDFLDHEGLIAGQKIPERRPTPVERYVQAYEEYLRDARALARATIVNYLPFIRDFLKACFGDGRIRISRLRAVDVVRFVQQEASRLRPKRAKLMTTALRSFLRYARYRGNITLDLAAAVPSVANWSMSSIPRSIPTEQIRQLLSSIDRHSATGRRDYAILLLLARLGLRAGEVTFLELDDIDWGAGQLSVHGKSGQRSALPVPADVGKAIAEYLRHGRPLSPCRRVFLRARAPIAGFRGSIAVSSVVRRCIQRAGVSSPTTGAHQFRHALATEMLRHGASLGEIGELLGHHHPDTTTIYAKVDIKALRKLAVPWPGGVQ